MSELSETNVRRKQQGTRVSPFGWVMIAFLFALGVINFADKAVLGLAAIPIIKELHLSAIQYGLVSGSLFWLFSLSSVLVTAWADVVGTKKVLALLATTWALVQFATLFVISFPALLLTRAVLGAGEGPSYGTSVTAAAPWLPPDRRAFGLGVMTFGSSIGPVVFAPLLTFMIVAVGWRSAFALLGGIGALWVVIWLVVARERLADKSTPVHETHGARRRTRWSQVLPLIFSRTIVFSIFAAFSIYWGIALLLGWTPVYLVIVLHLKLTDPLYIVGVSLPWLLQGLALLAFGVLADRVTAGSRDFLHPCSDSRGCYSPAGSYRAGCDPASESRVCPGCRRGFLYAARFHCSPCDRCDDSGDRKPGRGGIAQRISVGRAVAPGRWRRCYGICAAG